GQKRVEVGRGAGLGGGGGCAGEGEVEEDQVLGAVTAAGRADAQVGRLDVPVVHSGLVEGDECLEQVGAVPLQQVQRQSLPLLQHLGQGLRAGGLQDERLPGADLHRALD